VRGVAGRAGGEGEEMMRETTSVEKRRAYKREWYQANRARIQERERAYKAANREKIREWSRAYYAANREKLLAYGRAYREMSRLA